MRRITAIVIVLFLTAIGLPKAFCQNDKPSLGSRHCVRFGWGDMIYESIAFRPSLNGTWATHPNVVIGGDSVDHIHVGTGLAGQFQAVLDDSLHMYQPMTLAEFIVFR